MKIFTKIVNVYLYKVIVVVVLLAIVLFSFSYFKINPNSPWAPLLGGMITGLIVALLQLLLMFSEHNEIEKIKKLGIKEILPHRDNEQFYREVIERAQKSIVVLGTTASRFMIDFADKDQSRTDKRALINALKNNVKIRFLLPDPKFLNDTDRARAKIALESIKLLASQYNGLIECKHFSSSPAHSLVWIDNDCFVGPIFPNTTSKNTPTIFTDSNRVFAEEYIKYFEYEWERSVSCL